MKNERTRRFVNLLTPNNGGLNQEYEDLKQQNGVTSIF